jgi:hypothetical protein
MRKILELKDLPVKYYIQRTYAIPHRVSALESVGGPQNIDAVGLISQCYFVVKELMHVEIGSPVWGLKSREFWDCWHGRWFGSWPVPSLAGLDSCFAGFPAHLRAGLMNGVASRLWRPKRATYGAAEAAPIQRIFQVRRPVPWSMASLARRSASRLCSRRAWPIWNQSSWAISSLARAWRSFSVAFFTL